MTGANSEAEADALRLELTACLQECGFSVRRWCSNSPAVLKDVPVEDRVCNFGPKDEETTDGMKLSYMRAQDITAVITGGLVPEEE